MQARTNSPAVKLLPSMTDLAFLAPVLFLFARMDGLKTLLSDCDTGWHIRTGEWILANHTVPLHDIFSFSKPDGVWYAWEWLSEILMAGLNYAGGLRVVVLATILFIAGLFAFLFRRLRSKSNPFVALAVTLVAMAASSIHWLARPHLVTLLFIILFQIALDRVREGRTRLWGIPYLVLMPIVTILWTNLHGGFFVGITLIGAYGMGELGTILFTTDPEERLPAWRRARLYFLSAFGCLAASLVNPYTYHLHVHVFQYLRDPYQAQHIVEFLSLNFQHPVAIFLETMLLLGAGTAFWNARRGRYAEPVYLLVWGHAALLASRNIPVFMIMAAPPVAEALGAWLEKLPECNVAGWLRAAARKFNSVALETAETDDIPRWHPISVMGILLVAAIIYAPHPPKHFRAEFDPKFYPAGAVEMLKRDASARVFTNDEWGDYLIYRMYPQQRVFVDGRSDFYGAKFEEKYLDVMSVKDGWEKILNGFGVNTILTPPGAPLTGALKQSSHWQVAYDDGIALVFHPAGYAAAQTGSVTTSGGGEGRDREVTKTQARDRVITESKPKT